MMKQCKKKKKKPCLPTSNGNVVIWCFDLLHHAPFISQSVGFWNAGCQLPLLRMFPQMNRNKVCVGNALERRKSIETLNFLLSGNIQLILGKYTLLGVGTDISVIFSK